MTPLLSPLNDNEGPISNIIEKYKNQPTVIAIKNAFPSHSFVCETVSRDEILKEIRNLKSSKATQVTVKENATFFS